MDQQHVKKTFLEPVQQRASRMDHDVRRRQYIQTTPGFTITPAPAASMGQTGRL
jgi:hypothetical protein